MKEDNIKLEQRFYVGFARSMRSYFEIAIPKEHENVRVLVQGVEVHRTLRRLGEENNSMPRVLDEFCKAGFASVQAGSVDTAFSDGKTGKKRDFLSWWGTLFFVNGSLCSLPQVFPGQEARALRGQTGGGSERAMTEAGRGARTRVSLVLPACPDVQTLERVYGEGMAPSANKTHMPSVFLERIQSFVYAWLQKQWKNEHMLPVDVSKQREEAENQAREEAANMLNTLLGSGSDDGGKGSVAVRSLRKRTEKQERVTDDDEEVPKKRQRTKATKTNIANGDSISPDVCEVCLKDITVNKAKTAPLKLVAGPTNRRTVLSVCSAKCMRDGSPTERETIQVRLDNTLKNYDKQLERLGREKKEIDEWRQRLNEKENGVGGSRGDGGVGSGRGGSSKGGEKKKKSTAVAAKRRRVH